MKIVYSDKHARHDPQTFLVRGVIQKSAEQPERATRLLAAARDAGHEVVAPKSFGLAPVQAIHTPEYIDFLQVAAREWAKLPGAGPEVVPNVHPARYPATYPRALVGRAGWHQADTGCPIGPGTWEAALASAETAATAAEMVLAGADEAYALCRPPGHHAYADMAAGFCFLNNTAIAAQHLRRQHARVAVLDVDVHHGNGTQGIFFERDDVLTVSIHADPNLYIPISGATPTRPAPARATATISTCRCRSARPTGRGSTPATRRWPASANSHRPRWWWRWASTPARAIRCRA
jgi:acetoin utilization deacetylase AcuC-like enzyme